MAGPIRRRTNDRTRAARAGGERIGAIELRPSPAPRRSSTTHGAAALASLGPRKIRPLRLRQAGFLVDGSVKPGPSQWGDWEGPRSARGRSQRRWILGSVAVRRGPGCGGGCGRSRTAGTFCSAGARVDRRRGAGDPRAVGDDQSDAEDLPSGGEVRSERRASGRPGGRPRRREQLPGRVSPTSTPWRSECCVTTAISSSANAPGRSNGCGGTWSRSPPSSRRRPASPP
jgi:hypothetical protein